MQGGIFHCQKQFGKGVNNLSILIKVVGVNNNNSATSPTHYAVPRNAGALRLHTALPNFNQERTDMGMMIIEIRLNRHI